MEFVDVADDARRSLASYIATELERGPGDAARPPVS
jgi:hypothetical protein